MSDVPPHVLPCYRQLPPQSETESLSSGNQSGALSSLEEAGRPGLTRKRLPPDDRHSRVTTATADTAAPRPPQPTQPRHDRHSHVTTTTAATAASDDRRSRVRRSFQPRHDRHNRVRLSASITNRLSAAPVGWT